MIPCQSPNRFFQDNSECRSFKICVWGLLSLAGVWLCLALLSEETYSNLTINLRFLQQAITPLPPVSPPHGFSNQSGPQTIGHGHGFANNTYVLHQILGELGDQ